ncbi:hypothetical protein HCN44_003425 [Aphidius gifuensis]|uniref:Uncharacterized protein n=1 Tax=Aphidius gifuensis TaxID=684658 RepID=A0A834XL11_APHGI|nr:hypothetical protein HCN44_003425 [Aphidius gifuensis]
MSAALKYVALSRCNYNGLYILGNFTAPNSHKQKPKSVIELERFRKDAKLSLSYYNFNCKKAININIIDIIKKKKSSNGRGTCITPESTEKISSSSKSSAKKTPNSARKKTNNDSPIDDIIVKRRKINNDLLADVLSSSPISLNTTGRNYQRHLTDTIKIQITINDIIFYSELRLSEQNKTFVLNIQIDITDKFKSDTGCNGKLILTPLSGDHLTADNILNVISSTDSIVKLTSHIDDSKFSSSTERYKKI